LFCLFVCYIWTVQLLSLMFHLCLFAREVTLNCIHSAKKVKGKPRKMALKSEWSLRKFTSPGTDMKCINSLSTKPNTNRNVSRTKGQTKDRWPEAARSTQNPFATENYPLMGRTRRANCGHFPMFAFRLGKGPSTASRVHCTPQTHFERNIAPTRAVRRASAYSNTAFTNHSHRHLFCVLIPPPC
jgi:hypothetical protein